MDELQQATEGPRPSYARVPSRSSTSSSNTRVASLSNSDTSIARTSPKPSAHPSHRFHHSACSKPLGSPKMASRHSPHVSRQGSTESTRQIAVSSYLQEKLDKERKIETEKLNTSTRSRGTADNTSWAGTSQSSLASPSKSSRLERQRPSSSGGGAEVGAAKSMGLKEMETVIDNLVKQNFDLKLEIHHRREKQDKLDRYIESLESEKNEVQEMNDKLLEELERRDKAVEEAVAMIVSLEARMEDIVLESGKGQDHQFLEEDRSVICEDEEHNRTPTTSQRPQLDGHKINRMPSFLWDRTEHTENLRSTYLSMRNSVLSLPLNAEEPAETEQPHDGLASPTLSLLSESSFLSIYGPRAQHESNETDPDEESVITSVDGIVDSNRGTGYAKADRNLVPERNTNLSTSTHQKGSTWQQQNSIGSGSPLQRIERTDSARATRKDVARSQSPANAFHPQSRPLPKVPLSYRQQLKDEKLANLKRVVTEAPGGVRLQDDTLPPTPDTISTSTLRRLQNSDDTLAGRRRELAREHDESTPVDGGAMVDPQFLLAPFLGGINARDFAEHTEGRTTSFGDHGTTHARNEHRPHSAGGASVIHKRGNDWGSSESEYPSRDSSLDMWMQAGAKPDRDGRSTSPDLFGFPESGGVWTPDAMFGRNSIQPGSATDDINKIGVDKMRDLFSINHALFENGVAPPTPNRRSSLHARTGSITASPRHVNASSKPQPSPDHSSRQPRRNSEAIRIRSQTATPVQTQISQPSSEQKRNHYPPVSGQPSRMGVKRLFRRSVGGGIPIIAPEPEQPRAAETAPSTTAGGPKPYNLEGMGIPSRIRAAEDEISCSATPPPIMRHGRRESLGLDVTAAASSVASTGPQTPTTAIPAGKHLEGVTLPDEPLKAPSPVGGRRKWLPAFGRTSSLKNRAP